MSNEEMKPQGTSTPPPTQTPAPAASPANAETPGMPAPAPEAEANGSSSLPGRLATLLLGVLLIVLITPLSMFLTVMTVNSDLETASPAGWVVGIVFTILLLLVPFRLLSRRKTLARPNLVLLFVMLSIAVPVMNLGAVRQTMLTMHATTKEFFFYGTSTYRTVYGAMRPEWSPVVPDRDALAWNKANRALELFQDRELLEASRRAASEIRTAIQLAGIPVEGGADENAAPSSPAAENAETGDTEDAADATAGDAPEAEIPVAGTSVGTGGSPEALQALVPTLLFSDLDELEKWIHAGGTVERERKQAAFAALGLEPLFVKHRSTLLERSARAALFLPRAMARADEFTISRLPSIFNRLDIDSRMRIGERTDARLRAELLASGLEREDLPPRSDELQRMKLANGSTPRVIQSLHTLIQDEGELRQNIMALTPTDFARVREALAERERENLAALSADEYRAVRRDYAYRLTRHERNRLIQQTGRGGEPHQNLNAFFVSIWPAVPVSQDAGFLEKLGLVYANIPWHLYTAPLVHWFVLFLVVFLFFLCLAEYLRRKWVERENLAFPLVEVIDGFIRHDANLESAEDLCHPPRRQGVVSPAFLLGFALAFLILSVEALGHYGITATPFHLYFNVSEELFTTGWLRSAGNVRFVISPIVVGLAFLVSLEVSFSIWITFILYTLMTLLVGSATGGIVDNRWSGYAGGRFFPFPMEQMAGACILFTIILLVKAWGTPVKSVSARSVSGSFLPQAWVRVGLVVCPLVAGYLIWTSGVQSIWLLLVCGGLALAQAVAAARVRAETGLPGQHVTYDFSKVPQVGGMSGSLGSEGVAAWSGMAFFPLTLVFRSLSQHLENIELARRHRLRYGWVAGAALLAFVVALPLGMVCFLLFGYWMGENFASVAYPGQPGIPGGGIAHYPLWNLHYQGEEGLGAYTEIVWLRVYAALIGAGVLGLLMYLRRVFLKFPIHPVGYMVLLLSLYYLHVSPYAKGDDSESSLVWGGVFVAWVIKKLVVKYGGMNAYKSAKPFFISLVVGSVVAVFAWNMLDLTASILDGVVAEGSSVRPYLEVLVNAFKDKPPFNPRYY